MDIVEGIAGSSSNASTTCRRCKACAGETANDTLIVEQLGWEPSISLKYETREDASVDFEQVTSGAHDEPALAFQGT